MVVNVADFDRVATSYQWLEYAAFGRTLERARFTGLEHLRGCREILLLGDGDGRALARLLTIAPESRVTSVDASRRMLDLARARVAATDRDRVSFQQADARAVPVVPGSFDAVVTLFFLDCFSGKDVETLVDRMTPALRDNGLWIFTDFVVPPRGVGRIAGQLVTAVLYRYFRWRTGLDASELPPSERAIQDAGFAPVESRTFARGLVRTVVFRLSGVAGRLVGERTGPRAATDDK